MLLPFSAREPRPEKKEGRRKGVAHKSEEFNIDFSLL